MDHGNPEIQILWTKPNEGSERAFCGVETAGSAQEAAGLVRSD